MQNINNDYENYKLQWMLDHGYNLNDLMNILIESVKEGLELEPKLNVVDAIRQGYDCLDSVNGFNGKFWATESEWKSNDNVINNLIVRPINKFDMDSENLEIAKDIERETGYKISNWAGFIDYDFGVFKKNGGLNSELIGSCKLAYINKKDDIDIVQNYPLSEEHNLWLTAVYIRPEFRGCSIGSYMIDQAIQIKLKDKLSNPEGKTAIFVELENEDEVNYFAKNGFTLIPKKENIFFYMVKNSKGEEN